MGRPGKNVYISAFLVVATVLAVGAFFWATWPAPSVAPAPASGKLKVITTFLPMYVFTKNVAGDLADVENLLPPGVGPHDYSFTPGDIRKTVGADVIVANGLGLETWMTDLISKSGSHAKLVEAASGITGKSWPDTVAVPGGAAGGETTGDVNPHVWLDPVLAEREVATIADGLAAADPAHAADYRRNAADYSKQLERLDSDYKAALDPIADKAFVAFHPAFDYLASRYGMNQLAVIEEFPGKEPGARYLTGLVDLIRQRGVKVLFSEPQFSPKVAETVASETGARVYELDTVEIGEFDPGTYVKVMRDNLKTLVRAFSS